MLEETEEIVDCIDLVQGNEYTIKFHFNNPNTIYARKFAERYNGIYKLIEEIKPNREEGYYRHFYKLINDNNLQLWLTNYGPNDNDNDYGFICEITDGTNLKNRQCKVYKINNTEYILK